MPRYCPAVTASRARFVAVALFVTPVVGACGAGGDDGRATGAKGRYVAQVDPVCVELQAKVGELGQEAGKQAEDVNAAIERIKAVPKPAEDSEIADLYRAALENVALSLQAVDQGRMAKDQGRVDRGLADAKINNQRAAEAAQKYGMVECARPL